MFPETAKRIDGWTGWVNFLKNEIEELKNNSNKIIQEKGEEYYYDELCSLQESLYEAKNELNFAWQDDEY